MPFSGGGTLAHGVPVYLSEGLADAPRWQQTGNNTGGVIHYRKDDGCLAPAKVRTSQWPLVSGGDRESTEKLFTYLDPTILPKYLKPASLRWGGEPGKPGPAVEVLALERAALPKGKAAILARVFGRAGSSVFVTVSCPSAPALAAARTDVARWLTVRRRQSGACRLFRPLFTGVCSEPVERQCPYQEAEVAQGDVVEAAEDEQIDDDPQQPRCHHK